MKIHKIWNGTKDDMSKYINVTKDGTSQKNNCHNKWNVTKRAQRGNFRKNILNRTKDDMSCDTKCNTNCMSQNKNCHKVYTLQKSMFIYTLELTIFFVVVKFCWNEC